MAEGDKTFSEQCEEVSRAINIMVEEMRKVLQPIINYVMRCFRVLAKWYVENVMARIESNNKRKQRGLPPRRRLRRIRR